ncbi:hypothetical protein Q9L42_020530 (plasmid) [Methylomarinum sp. Ch1-1]|uniref:Deoxynucleotide monophosphate kinase n=1 Tax=Methylomarinum roseum TaxID=3067653 RepID=A0AAU7P1J5_9GAMM|nr:hypothetical protein [Methylomarinum sp. Ch1-1]MDP4523305.1 hypothetical protein [Methylomarinum sp. Ch1-1]
MMDSNVVVIGLSGLAGSGKDTAAIYMAEEYRFHQIAFADPMRAGVKALFGLPESYFKTGNKDKIIPSIGQSTRHLLQRFGTSFGCAMLGESIWTDVARQRISSLQKHHGVDRIVISDVRTENEAAMIRHYPDGKVFHIKRDKRCPGAGLGISKGVLPPIQSTRKEKPSLRHALKNGLIAAFDLEEQHFSPANIDLVIPWIGKSPFQLIKILGTQFGFDLLIANLVELTEPSHFLNQQIDLRLPNKHKTEAGVELHAGDEILENNGDYDELYESINYLLSSKLSLERPSHFENACSC